MSKEQREVVLADILCRKHEYYDSDIEPIEAVHEGRRLTLLAPEVVIESERIEVRTILTSDDLIVAIAHHSITGKYAPDERGIILIGRKRDESTYLVHVWHELFPQALELLGLRLDTDGKP